MLPAPAHSTKVEIDNDDHDAGGGRAPHRPPTWLGDTHLRPFRALAADYGLVPCLRRPRRVDQHKSGRSMNHRLEVVVERRKAEQLGEPQAVRRQPHEARARRGDAVGVRACCQAAKR